MLNSNLPYRQPAITFCSPWASLKFILLHLVGKPLASALAHQVSDNEKLFYKQENLLVPDKWTKLFWSPDVQGAEIHVPGSRYSKTE